MEKNSLILLFFFSICASHAQLFINEALVQNVTSITDNFNEHDDWIEIYNSGNISLDLSGYYMTDDPTNLDKHEIISGNAALTTVPPGGHLILWADEDENQGENHLNFRLSDEETILLVDPDGLTIISTLVLPSLKDDESFGRTTDGSATTRIFKIPTPAQSNSLSLDANIQFSESSKTFVNPFNLVLTTDAADGVLRFTTNGSNPTNSSSIYSSPIPISETTTVKAAFFFNNGNVSVIKTERFVEMTSSMANASSDIPMVLIHTYNQVLNDSTEQTTFISIIEPNNNGRANGDDPPSIASRAGMRIRGSSSSSFPKKQWRVEFQNEDGSDRDVEMLGMPADGDWVLYAPGRLDRPLITNPLMYEISNRLGKYAPRTRFVEVYYNEDNTLEEADYWGIYIMTERIEVNDDRVDITVLDPTDNSGEALTGGYLASLDREQDIVTPYINSFIPDFGIEMRSPDIGEITPTQLSYFENELLEFENALTSPNWLDPISGYKTRVNIESFIIPHMLKAFSKEPDGFRLSTFFQKDRNGLLEAGPVWDFDRAINSLDQRSQIVEGWATSHPNSAGFDYWMDYDNGRPYIRDLVNDPDYETLIYDSWYEWRRNNILETSELNMLIDSLVNIITESQVRNGARWTGQMYNPRFGGYSQEIAEMKNWLQLRSAWIDGEFLSPPDFAPGSGTFNLNSLVTISNTTDAGTIYYTIDGSDPREPGGATSASALVYTGPIQISKKGLTFLTARTRLNNGKWSAICTQEYFVAENYDGLVINEIHYNPNDEIVNGDTISGRNFEFIELKNCGSFTLNLNGLDFIEGGVDLDITDCLTIAPNDFVVLAEDKEWFLYKYGFEPDAEYREKLDDGGELLHLVDPLGNLIDSVRYNDGLPWPGTADRGFYSLALQDCALDNTDPMNWSIQSVFTTPRAENFFTDFGQHGFSGIVINEIHYNPMDGLVNSVVVSGTNYEFVELKNISSAPIDLTNVFFSRGIDYFFPENTIIQPGDFIVLAENVTRFQERYGFVPFDSYGGRLSNSGETLWLERITLSGNVLLDAVTYDDIFPWDFNADGGAVDYSLALVDGTVDNDTYLNWSVQCNSLFTPGTENDLGCFTGVDYSGLTINEIDYSPNGANDLEFLELVNNSFLPIDMEGLRISDGITYDFNGGQLFPGQYYLIARDSAFVQNTYGVTVDGNYTGGLSSNGETIRLSDLFGNPIDVVTYGVSAPWTDEPAQGVKSLALIDPSLDNNVAAHWCVQLPNRTPKAANVFVDSDNDGLIDCADSCPVLDNSLINTPCDDGNVCTIGETWDSNCNCSGGSFQDSDSDGVCDAQDQCNGIDDALIGSPCDDGDPCTLSETFDANCQCSGGVFTDSDNDGTCDAFDQCPNFDNNLIGQICDDNDLCTANDTYNNNCDCVGTPVSDSDGDGACDAIDQCPNFDNNLIGTPCDDGIICFVGSTWDSNCNCNGGAFADTDGDNICDPLDECPDFDDNIDINNNGIPDGCEGCADFVTEASNSIITQDRKANISITTNGRVFIGNVNYQAGQEINLIEGFEVKAGAVFHAYISPCD